MNYFTQMPNMKAYSLRVELRNVQSGVGYLIENSDFVIKYRKNSIN